MSDELPGHLSVVGLGGPGAWARVITWAGALIIEILS
jgi:hypothetical protein